MKQKRRKLSMKVKDGLGPACTTCALPMQRWKHDPKWKGIPLSQVANLRSILPAIR